MMSCMTPVRARFTGQRDPAMSAVLDHPLVRDYLRGLDAALAGLPP